MKWTFDSSGINARTYSSGAKQLKEYIARLQKISKTKGYAFPESSVCLPADGEMQRVIGECIRTTSSSKLRYIIVIGIGGSNLGVKAVYDAMRECGNAAVPDIFPKILFVDSLYSEWITQLRALLLKIKNPAEFLFVIISKSGTTTESVAAADVLLAAVKHVKNGSRRVVAITDRHSLLWQRAEKNKWHALEIPARIGGRFSIFSPVGLFPLAIAGFDIGALQKGALAMRAACLHTSFLKNPALSSALNLFANYQRGFTVHNTFLFAPQLESLGKWYRQLLGESIGKEYDIREKRVHAGIVPTVSIGSMDLHSVGQLYLGGPRIIVTTFVRVKNMHDVRVPARGVLHGLVSGIASRSLSEITDALIGGTKAAYRNASLPFVEYTLDRISEKELGAFFQWKMMEIMYLGQLFGVNAFDQPNVESYKSETRKRLQG